MLSIEEEMWTPNILTQPPMLTPLTNSVLVGLFDEAAVVATDAPTGVEICLDAAVKPKVLIVDAVDVSLEKVTTAVGDDWTEARLVPGI